MNAKATAKAAKAASKSAAKKSSAKTSAAKKSVAKKSSLKKAGAKKAKAVARRPAKKNLKLKNISEVRRYFHRNEDPIFFISATNFNLLGIDEWCRNFRYINYIDCYDGRHPNAFIPTDRKSVV